MSIYGAIAGFALALFPEIAFALEVDFATNIYGRRCPVTGVNGIGGIGCGTTSGQDYLNNLISGNYGLKSMFATLLLAALIFYSVKLLVGSRDDNVITETRMAYLNAVIGAVVIGGAYLLANTFTLPDGELVAEQEFNQVVVNVVVFLKAIMTTLALVNVVIQGIRLLVAQEDGEIDKARKRFLHGAIGAAIVILGNAMIDTFYLKQMVVARTEIAGIASYIATFFGALAVFGVIIAGIILIVSVDESLQDRAKKLIIACLISLVVILLAYGLVTTFLGGAATGTGPLPFT